MVAEELGDWSWCKHTDVATAKACAPSALRGSTATRRMRKETNRCLPRQEANLRPFNARNGPVPRLKDISRSNFVIITARYVNFDLEPKKLDFPAKNLDFLGLNRKLRGSQIRREVLHYKETIAALKPIMFIESIYLTACLEQVRKTGTEQHPPGEKTIYVAQWEQHRLHIKTEGPPPTTTTTTPTTVLNIPAHPLHHPQVEPNK
ncbi:uncharacterized protein PGTG_05261 [Puccinia graminis f. sp. tritici CRL 75-36-700-3]|uniref:Uncharacterized protein n=1 Tax=Puccinia graminis f. sp. tritici (strain CRL 75-36-700-3 / race SCCL) TaxID=418459 RepID=E3K6P0_PUCGT|nr:uncharacterized protein PGTG_05261 [Puccinia graminis f. sp. tritici CRL 75-36-700-3]EFP80036.1 hypothetical protein PGTG_05261 [Puccinia graminis f. sp. tritici CRL 75-36-700-3]